MSLAHCFFMCLAQLTHMKSLLDLRDFRNMHDIQINDLNRVLVTARTKYTCHPCPKKT